MGVTAGPNVLRNGLLFAIDSAGPSSISPLGCTGFNNAPQLLKNLISRNDTITSYNGVRLANMSFYTTFGISYPEGSYGGDAASRQGVTPGYDVRSGSKTYDASRSLHMWVWNENTQSWVPDSYFRGLRLSGNCYDNWNGYGDWQVELNYFNADLAAINAAFPNCTYIICGSHAAQNYDTATINNLISLGAPSATVSSWNSNDTWREFVLVGKPGLGSGNAYGWAYQNYSTNPSEVAHLNFGLPAYGRNDTLNFDGTNDYVAGPNNAASFTGDMTAEAWIKINALPSDWVRIVGSGGNSGNRTFGLWYSTTGRLLWQRYGATDPGIYPTSPTLATNTWYHIVATTSGTSHALYLNGTSIGTATAAGPWGASGENTTIGYAGFHTYTTSNIAAIRLYNTGLTEAQVLQNFTAHRDRFGI